MAAFNPIVAYCNPSMQYVEMLIGFTRNLGSFSENTLNDSHTFMRQIIPMLEQLSRIEATLLSTSRQPNVASHQAYRALADLFGVWFAEMLERQRSYRQQVLANEQRFVGRLFHLAHFREANHSLEERQRRGEQLRQLVRDHEGVARLGYRQWAYYYHVNALYHCFARKSFRINPAFRDFYNQALNYRVEARRDSDEQDRHIRDYWRRLTAVDADELKLYLHAMLRRDRTNEGHTPVDAFWRVFNEYRVRLYGDIYGDLTEEQEIALNEPFFREIVERRDDLSR